MAVTDARVKFLRGLQADLPSTKTDGNVYVAYDERAMYVDYTPTGGSTVERIRLGDIIEVATINDLPTASQPKSTTALYYVKDGNILAKWDTTAGDWQQINGQSISNIIKAMAWNITTAGNATSTIKLNITKPDNTPAFGSTLSWKLASANTTAMQLSSAADTNGIYTITMRVKDLIEITELKTTTTAYSANEVPLNLYNYSTGTDATGATVSKPASLTPTNTINLVGDGIAHVKSDANGTITIGTKISLTGSFNSSGDLKLAIKDTILNIDAATATISPIIQIGKSGATSNIKFVNGTAVLPVYTIDQTNAAIEEKLKAADSMSYKGTVGAASDGASITSLPLTTGTVSIGDTYKVVTNNTYTINNLTTGNTQDAAVGDMFIATSVDGTENAAGYIEPSKIRWTYIPSGDDTQTVKFTYADATKDLYIAVNGVNNGVKLRVDQTDLTTTSTGSGTNQVVTLAHKAYAAITPTADTTTNAIVGATGGDLYGTASFTAITGITVSNGHITAVKTGTITVGHLKLKSFAGISALYNGSTAVTAGASAKASGARLTSTITFQDNTTMTSIFNLKSDSLTFTRADANAATALGIDLMWETF